MPTDFKEQTLYDFLDSFPDGVNQGRSPLDLARTSLSNSVNTTVRGEFVTHRSSYCKRPVIYGQSSKVPATQAVFQGACQATDDAGNASLVTLISQRVFQFLIQGNVITCQEILIPGGPILPNQPQAWLWQSERWVIVQDGVNPPIFLDLNGGVGITPVYGLPNFATAVRSNSGTPQNFSTTTASQFAINPASSTATTTGVPAGNQTIGTTDTDGGLVTYALYQYINTTTTTVTENTGESVGIPAVGQLNSIFFSSTTHLEIDDIVTIQGCGTFQVTNIVGLNVTLQNLTGANPGGNVNSGVPVTWTHIGSQMPPGRMGAYGLGRNWLSLPGGIDFIAGDIVDGSSGTQAYGFRDAVLNVTENNFIVGGGTFSIPASGGETIQAMLFQATLDASLGQGPLTIFTNYRCFSCNAPVDRLTWQALTNPILSVSLISNGAEGQNSTVMVNGDPFFRSVDGQRSLVAARRDFWSWGNVPISFEVSTTLGNDNPALLGYTSAVVFDNRYLLTTQGVQSSQGVYFTGIVPINFDPISSIRGKAQPVWDSGLWTGMNSLQLTTGEVQNVQRAFAFCLNTSSPSAGIELYEILPSQGPLNQNYDWNGSAAVPITWSFDSPSLRFAVKKDDHKFMYLSNGEIAVNQMTGTVDFKAYYLPDQYPTWTLWQSWTAQQNAAYAANGQPDFLPRQGLGQPSPAPCDPSTNRQLRSGFTFQFRFVITGDCTIVGVWLEAQTLPMPKFAKVQSCPATVSYTPPTPTNPMTCMQPVCGNYGGTTPNFTPACSCMIAWDTFFTVQPAMWLWSTGKWTNIIAGQ